MLLDESQEIMSTVIERAKKGDRTAMTLCIERLIPRLKDAAELPVEKSEHGPMEVVVRFVDSQNKPVEVPGFSKPETPTLAGAEKDCESAKQDAPELFAIGQEDARSRQEVKRAEPQPRRPVPGGRPWS